MSVELVIKWKGEELIFDVETSETVGSLKRKIQEKTFVHPKRQKLLGVKAKGQKLAGDDVLISQLQLKPGQRILLMGSPDSVIEDTEKCAAGAPQIADDFDLAPESEKSLDVKDDPDVKEKLQRRINSVELKVLTLPRAGKKLLVLDIDYTLFDLGSSAEQPDELARPYLHEFLTGCYQFYDIMIWSATPMKWVEVKMKELGVLGHSDYKVACMLDDSAMLTLQTEEYGVFNCKPLAFIWAKFPDFYNEDNTVMLDDLRRNFVMNKQNGLVIRPYRHAHRNKDRDKELLYLQRYLEKIGTLDKLSHLDHRNWWAYLQDSSH